MLDDNTANQIILKEAGQRLGLNSHISHDPAASKAFIIHCFLKLKKDNVQLLLYYSVLF